VKERDCGNCGKTLHIHESSSNSEDWRKVVCSNCNAVNSVSMVRVSELPSI